MRTEKEMLDLIKGVANREESVRAAYLEGSRANPKIPRDIFQDYDVIYIVTSTAPFRKNREWIDCFGKRLYMQYPEENDIFPSDVENCYGWLIQFEDGNRLDLHVCTKEYALSHLELYQTLVDKDGIMPKEKETCDKIYWVTKPGEKDFLFTCNEFWWCLNNVAKGLWRRELPYALEMLDFHVRPMLKQLLQWKIGMEHNFSVNPGKGLKYLNQFLPEKDYQKFLRTYAAGEVNAIWKAVFHMCDLFHSTAMELSAGMGLYYDTTEARNSRAYLEHVQGLPQEAKEIYGGGKMTMRYPAAN